MFRFPRSVRHVCHAWNKAAIDPAYEELDLTWFVRNRRGNIWPRENEAQKEEFLSLMNQYTKRVLLGEGRLHHLRNWVLDCDRLSKCHQLELIQ
jgi:hypothetical protein